MRMKKLAVLALVLVVVVGMMAGTVFADTPFPEAEVTVREPLTLGPNEHTVFTGSGWPMEEDLSRPLDVVMNFKATEEITEDHPYSAWAGDFYLTFGGIEGGTLVTKDCYLAGVYEDGAFKDLGWIVIPTDNMENKTAANPTGALTVESGVTYPVLSGFDSNLTYNEICNNVKNFTAAIYVADEILLNNPNFTVTLELKLRNPDNAEDLRTVGVPAVYTAEQMLINKGYVAKIGEEYYTLSDALAKGGNITLLSSTVLTEPVTVPAGVNAVLDLNGKTISATDSTTGKNFNLIVNKGTLEIKDSLGDGKITVTATANKAWSHSSSVISNEGGVLTLTSGTLEHKGGSDMAYGIDNNSTLGATTLHVNGGTVISPYRAVRLFQNSSTQQNTVNIGGGKLVARACVWMHQAGADSLGTVNVTAGTLESVANAIVVDIHSGGKSDITISDGTFTNTSETANLLLVWPYSNISTVTAANKTTMTITGGTFDCAGEGNLIGLLDGADAFSEVKISGGTFSEDITDTYIVEGKESVAVPERGVWIVHTHDSDDVIEGKDATCTEAGNKAGTKCSVCGKVMSGNEVIPAGHKLTKVEAEAATCTAAGNIEHYTCSGCTKLFNNDKAEKELAAADVVIAVAGHKLTKVEAKAATCTTAGNIEHYTCSGCNKLFNNDKAEKELNTSEIAVAATGHKLTKVEAKEATYTAAGNTEHYACACGALFADAEGKTATTAEAVAIPQLIKVEDSTAKVETGAIDKAIEEAEKNTGSTGEVAEVVIEIADAKTEENAQEVQSVVEVELPVESLDAVAEKEADLTVVLPSATVTMDTEALEAVSEQAAGQTVALVVKEVETKTLTASQQKVAEKYDVAMTITAELICQQTGEKIWTEDANKAVPSGKITVKIPFTPAANTKGSDYAILYVADNGSTKKIDTDYVDGCLVFELEHFSDYIVINETKKPAASTPATGDLTNVGFLFAMMTMAAVGTVAVVTLKKRAYR